VLVATDAGAAEIAAVAAPAAAWLRQSGGRVSTIAALERLSARGRGAITSSTEAAESRR
jgi:hypothetical protein